jgi:WD40 repeat protein/serine/threonine protein kinase
LNPDTLILSFVPPSTRVGPPRPPVDPPPASHAINPASPTCPPPGNTHDAAGTTDLNSIREPLEPVLNAPPASSIAKSRALRPADAAAVTAFLAPNVDSSRSFIGQELTPGDRFDRYLILRELGRGGFGIVYLAQDTRLEILVTLKIPRPDRAHSPASLSSFVREARLASRLNHDAIVPILDADIAHGVYYITSRYYEGEMLSRCLSRWTTGISLRAAAELTARIADGLVHAHDLKIIHRDLKPANILLAKVDATSPASPAEIQHLTPRITDYGLGVQLDSENNTDSSGLFFGTIPYISPEQLSIVKSPVGPAADQYALGAILYELLTGQPIHKCSSQPEFLTTLARHHAPASIRSLRPDVPRDLEAICFKALEFHPRDRYPSLADLRDDLRRFLRGHSTIARPLPIHQRLTRWTKRNPGLATLSALVLIAVCSLAALGSAYHLQLRDAVDRQARHTNDLQSLNDRLQTALAQAHEQERLAKRTAYTTQIHLASEEIQFNRLESAQATLKKLRPGPGEPDPRGFEWFHLWNLASRLYTIAHIHERQWLPHALRPHPDLGPIDPIPQGWAFSIEEHTQLAPRIIKYSASHKAFHLAASFRFAEIADHGIFLQDGSAPVRTLRWDHPPIPDVIGHVAFTPDGQSLLVMNAEEPIDPSQPVTPQVSFATDDAGPPLRVITLPHATTHSFSADGQTLLLLASTQAHPSSVIPVTVHLSTLETKTYPDYSFPWRLDPDPGRTNNPTLNRRSRVALDPTGRVALVTRFDDKRLIAIDLHSNQILWSIPALSPDEPVITSIQFAPDGKTFVSGNLGGEVFLRDAESGQILKRFPRVFGRIAHVGFYPDAQTVAILHDDDHIIRFWNLDPPPEPIESLTHGDEVWDLAFTPDGKTLISAGDDDAIHFFDPSSLIKRASFTEHRSLVSSIALASNAKTLISADFDGTIHFLDVATQRPIRAPLRTRLSKIRDLELSPDDRWLVAAGNDSHFLVFDLLSNTERRIPTQGNSIAAAHFAPDGRTLVTANLDKSITAWNFPELSIRAVLPIHRVMKIDYSHKGDLIALADMDGTLHILDARSLGTRLKIERATDQGALTEVVFSPDDRIVATGGEDQLVRLWDPLTGSEIMRLTGHSAKIHALAFSPRGDAIASGCFDGIIRLWKAPPTSHQVTDPHPAPHPGRLLAHPSAPLENAAPGPSR